MKSALPAHSMQTPAERARSALPTHLIQSAPARAPLSKHTPRARLHTQKCFEKLAEHAPRARAERADRTFQSPPCNAPNAGQTHGLRRTHPFHCQSARSRQASGGQEKDKRKTTAGQEDDKGRTTAGQEEDKDNSRARTGLVSAARGQRQDKRRAQPQS